ncbi:CAP domain-containing protein [Lactobacillus sp. ESL0228]|uniref:CAP domain-containing protein n=1 Tax=Lactobacillus sp. ESL0228 TaxID=2069352 RepID=UPI001F47104B|nr:CAP domain-containing protein [Lactobacillus sp. ESL0228]
MKKKFLIFLTVSFIFWSGITVIQTAQEISATEISNTKANTNMQKAKVIKQPISQNPYLTNEQFKQLLKLLKPSYEKYLKDQKSNGTVNKETSSTTPNKQPSIATKNAISLMIFIANDNSLTVKQRQAAKNAANLLKTGKSNNQPAPSWFKKYVDLTSPQDATNSSNIRVSLKNLAKVNQARTAIGEKALKVSLPLIAISMIDADYQKRGGLTQPHYYEYTNNLENIAGGTEPVAKWLSEEINWKWDVKKTPSLAPNEFSPNWSNIKYDNAVFGTNGYRTAGHYLNLVNKQHRVMGMAHMTKSNYGFVDILNANYKDSSSAISFNQYKKLVTKWLKK